MSRIDFVLIDLEKQHKALNEYLAQISASEAEILDWMSNFGVIWSIAKMPDSLVFRSKFGFDTQFHIEKNLIVIEYHWYY
jgi:hypothetical protein